MFGNFKISNEEYISALSEINGVTPENWFIAINKGKDKKVNRGFLINNTENTIQLIPIKKENKVYIIDKENVITLSKIEEITKIVYVLDDLYSFLRIHLNNGFVYRLRVYNVFNNKIRRNNFEKFRKPYKKQSVKAQLSLAAFYVIFVALFAAEILYGVLNIPNNSKLYYHYNLAKDLRQSIDSGQFDEYMEVTLQPYQKGDLKLDGDFLTTTCENIRINIPDNCTLAEDSSTENMVVYTTGFDKENKLTIMIDYIPYDYSDSGSEEYRKFVDIVRDASIKEFGVSLDQQYNHTKAMWMINNLRENINYFNYKEVVMYRAMIVTKSIMCSGINKFYDVNTPSYCGFISERVIGNGIVITLDFYSYDSLDEKYQVTIIMTNQDKDEAYKILNSVELVTE